MAALPPLRLDRLPLLVTAPGDAIPHGAGRRPAALLPGSFDPIHHGHWSLADAARRLLNVPVIFEISVANVDKRELSADEVQKRVAQFRERGDVWITRAPRFVQKAELFPGVTFIVGADTALRLVLPRYYDDDESRMLQALERLHELGCRFLVAGRIDAAGRFVTLADLPVPRARRTLFTAISADAFRHDVSSTALRRAPRIQ